MKNMWSLNMNKLFFNLVLISWINIILIIYNNKLLIIMIMILMLTNNKKANPLYINILIIMMTIFISMKINFMMNNNWFSMMMFLVMIGGMMILFLYFNSFMINEEFKLMKSNFFLNILIKMVLFTIINYLSLMKLFKTTMLKMNLIQVNNYFLKFMNNESILMFILNYKTASSLIILIIYLLYSLMVITFLCMNKNLSLRKIN